MTSRNTEIPEPIAQAYRALSGTTADTLQSDADLEAVQRMFDLSRSTRFMSSQLLPPEFSPMVRGQGGCPWRIDILTDFGGNRAGQLRRATVLHQRVAR